MGNSSRADFSHPILRVTEAGVAEGCGGAIIPMSAGPFALGSSSMVGFSHISTQACLLRSQTHVVLGLDCFASSHPNLPLDSASCTDSTPVVVAPSSLG